MSSNVNTIPLFAPHRHRLSVWAWLRAALANRRSRSKLRSLDAHLLSDVGLSETDARKEADRPVWDVPGHWMK